MKEEPVLREVETYFRADGTKVRRYLRRKRKDQAAGNLAKLPGQPMTEDTTTLSDGERAR
jgi:hypothetical protein